MPFGLPCFGLYGVDAATIEVVWISESAYREQVPSVAQRAVGSPESEK